MLPNMHVEILKFMLNKRFRNKQSVVHDFDDSCAETEVYNRISVKFVLAKTLNQICGI